MLLVVLASLLLQGNSLSQSDVAAIVRAALVGAIDAERRVFTKHE